MTRLIPHNVIRCQRQLNSVVPVDRPIRGDVHRAVGQRPIWTAKDRLASPRVWMNTSIWTAELIAEAVVGRFPHRGWAWALVRA